MPSQTSLLSSKNNRTTKRGDDLRAFALYGALNPRKILIMLNYLVVKPRAFH